MEFSVTVTGSTTLVVVYCDVPETQLDGMLGRYVYMVHLVFMSIYA